MLECATNDKYCREKRNCRLAVIELKSSNGSKYMGIFFLSELFSSFLYLKSADIYELCGATYKFEGIYKIC